MRLARPATHRATNSRLPLPSLTCGDCSGSFRRPSLISMVGIGDAITGAGSHEGRVANRTSRLLGRVVSPQRILMVAVPSSSDTTSNSDDSFAALFEESLKHDEVKEGEIVKGKVIAIAKDNVVVDIGYKSEGTIAASEFIVDGQMTIKVGDIIDVFLESREDENGLCIVSKEKADRLKVWDEISAACERDELIEGTITARVKGGLQVSIRGGVKAFLPGSQVDLRPVRNLDKLIGQTFEFKVIKFNKKRGNIVLSRRVLLEKERNELKAQTLQKLEEGQVLVGTIKNLTEYGAFVDLGGIDGLLHITDMSWGRVNHPSEVFSVGDEVTVKILKYLSLIHISEP